MNFSYDDLKKFGFIRQRQKDIFIARFRSIAGNLTSSQLRHLAHLADKYGRGYVHVTTRQGAEIPWVSIDDYGQMKEEIGRLGLHTSICGPRIRPVVACPGVEVCPCGLMNSRETAEQLDRLFFGRQVSIKTKIAVSGCPNACAKPQENDIGLMGAIEPVLNLEKCVGCGLCQKVCPNRAIVMVNGKPQRDKTRCLFEGNCIFSCPVDAWQEKRRGYMLYAGGKIGRKPRLGQVVAEFVPENRAAEAVKKVLKAFGALARKGERLADTIARVGLDTFRSEMDGSPSRYQIAAGLEDMGKGGRGS